MKKLPRNILALLLSVLLLLSLAPLPVVAQAPAALRIALISDLHYFPEELSGGYGEAYKNDNIIGQPVEQGPGILEATLEAIKARHAQKEELDYLLITGDLTSRGELVGHEKLAGILEEFQDETGIQIAVIPGNHDVNYGAVDYSSGVRRDAERTGPEDFRRIYQNLGYGLDGNRADFVPAGEDYTGSLSYAVDLGEKYRLIAIDTHRRRIEPDLRDWVLAQCAQANENKQAIIGIGHHNLNEAFDGQLTVMQGQGIENMRQISEAFADAGMHFYFSGHLHMSEISPWYSDQGEVLYDIIVPGLYNFPGGYRVVNFSIESGKITAAIDTFPVDEVQPVTIASGYTYPPPFIASSLELSFGYEGGGLAGFVKAAAGGGLGDMLKGLSIADMADLGPLNALLEYLDKQLGSNTQRILDLINNLVDEAFALPVSRLPCTAFIAELGFGHPTKPGTLSDAGNSVLAYMFWKNHDPAKDAFVQDVLLRMKNGDLIAQVLDFAIPKALDVLGAEILPLLANVDVGLLNRAVSCGLGVLNLPLLLVLALLPGTRDTISTTLYSFASGAVTSLSPSGFGTRATLVYEGDVPAPTGPKTFRLPYNLNVTLSGDRKSAEITWYAKASLTSPQVRLNDMTGVSVTYSTELTTLTVNELDLGIMKMMGETLYAAKHTAVLEGLDPGKCYRFVAGDSVGDFWAGEQKLASSGENAVLAFFRQVWEWLRGMWQLLGILWRNRVF